MTSALVALEVELTDNANLFELSKVNVLHLILFNFVGNGQHRVNMKLYLLI